LRPSRGPQPLGVRAAVLVVAPRSCSLHLYSVRASGRVGARAARALPLRDARWPGVRAAVEALLPRARGCERVVVALRAALRRAPWRRRLGDLARAGGAALEALDGAAEGRFLFLGALHELPDAQDGFAADVEPEAVTLARFRGRVLAATRVLPGARSMGLVAALAGSGLVPTRMGEALLVGGSALDERARRALLRWTGSAAATRCDDALARGLGAAVLGAPAPETR